jgi:hypothetical protein
MAGGRRCLDVVDVDFEAATTTTTTIMIINGRKAYYVLCMYGDYSHCRLFPSFTKSKKGTKAHPFVQMRLESEPSDMSHKHIII